MGLHTIPSTPDYSVSKEPNEHELPRRGPRVAATPVSRCLLERPSPSKLAANWGKRDEESPPDLAPFSVPWHSSLVGECCYMLSGVWVRIEKKHRNHRFCPDS